MAQPSSRLRGGPRNGDSCRRFQACLWRVKRDDHRPPYHVVQRVETVHTGDENDGHRTLPVIKAMIPKGLVQRILVVLLYVTHGMSYCTYLKEVQPDFHPFLICTVELSQRDGMSVVVIDIGQENLNICVAHRTGRGVVNEEEGVMVGGAMGHIA